MTTLDPGQVLRTLLGANVQFVVVGDPESEGTLRLVVSAHPTNLDALGRALDGLSASVRLDEALQRREQNGGPGASEATTAGPRRVGDRLGTIAVSTSAGDAELLFGGPRGSLYGDTLATSQARDIGGVTVPWSAAVAEPVPPGRTTGKVISGRLFSLAGRLAQLVDRRGERAVDAPAAGTPAGEAAQDGVQRSGDDAPGDETPPGAG